MSTIPAPVITEANCADEPIHLPGSVQPHGFLLIRDEDGSHIEVASVNAADFLGRPLRLILGAPLDALFGRELLSSIELLRREDTFEGKLGYLGAFQVRDELFSVVTHCIGTRRVYEFERQEELVGPERMNAIITNFVASIGRVRSEAELFEAITAQLAALTRFNRILLYSFDEEGHGTVLAEQNDGTLPSFLGLRFPGTDIPAQARALYIRNTVRIIPDANGVNSPLRGVRAEDARAIDLSQSTLRSVSPIHLEYMRNMGTPASMSVSIVMDGRLWGLISCHHATPKAVPYLMRSAGDMLTRIVTTQLSALQTERRLTDTIAFQAAQRDLLRELRPIPDFIAGLRNNLPALLRFTQADGVALLADGDIQTHGFTPPASEIERLSAWLETMPEFDVFATSELRRDRPFPADTDAVASGLIAARISAVRHRHLLWFRREVVETVEWAGQPQIPGENKSLTPRSSFESWKETLRGRAIPWTHQEIESARNLHASLITIGLRRAEEAIELGEARFRQLTTSLPTKVFLCDDDGRLTEVNDRWMAEGLAAKGIWFEDAAIAGDDRKHCAALWQQCTATGQDFELEVCVHSRDEQDRWNLIRATPYRHRSGERIGWVGTCTDLTDSKEREMALRVNEKLALSGRMTSVIAHEINNPLEAITNLMYLLRSDLPEDGPATSYISMVESELERISGITKQTLRWNREHTDRSETFSARSLVDDTLRLFAGKIRNRSIHITVEVAETVHLRGVIGQVRQVLANIVSNGIDATPVGGPMRIAAIEEHGMQGFTVIDSGAGMSDTTRKRVFEPFYSTKGDLGNGLGLYISKEIMERHNGRIHIDSAPSKGTTVTILLPQ